MQAQSRLSVSGGSTSGFDPADEHEAVVRELTRGHELTARLQAEALRALRGQGQAEATAAFILQEVSHAFTVCRSIMAGSVPAATPRRETPESSVSAGARRARDDSAPRKETVSSTPHFDGYQWRKYGQKRIMKTNFPRSYYRCCYHRERNCPATKQVQQHSYGDPPLFVTIYVHEHTCHTSASEPEAANSATNPLDFSGLSRQGVHVLDRRAKEEHERALVSSLARVLSCGGGGGVPESSQGRTGGASASATSFDASDPLPRLGADEGLDVMDYDVTDTMFLGTSYGLRDDGMLF